MIPVPVGVVQSSPMPPQEAGRPNASWVKYLYELNIESVSGAVLSISVMLLVYFLASLLANLGGLFDWSILDIAGDKSEWSIVAIADLIVSALGVLTGLSGLQAGCTKNYKHASRFRTLMTILAIFYLISIVVYFVLDFKHIDDYLDDVLDIGKKLSIALLVVSFAICAGACWFCVGKSRRYHRYLVYYSHLQYSEQFCSYTSP
jgi:hypothetical protein